VHREKKRLPHDARAGLMKARLGVLKARHPAVTWLRQVDPAAVIAPVEIAPGTRWICQKVDLAVCDLLSRHGISRVPGQRAVSSRGG
jgi:hypothetical protein